VAQPTTVGIGRVDSPHAAVVSLAGHSCWVRNYTPLPLGTHQGFVKAPLVGSPLAFRLEFRTGRDLD
jgi:hypothetical protein